MTVEELSARMSCCEYMQWAALYEVEAEEQKLAMKRAQSGKGMA